MATFSCRVQYLDDRDPFANTNFPEPTRPPIYSFLDDVPLMNQIASIHRLLQAPHQLEDCALQLYRNQTGTQGEYGVYLDLESTLDEQAEELEGFTDQKKNAIILRTQLTVRVNSIIEKLLNSNGRELRRALFSLKQIFQDDKDLVHEFVNNDGLTCMVKVGSESDQNYQNYILRALGQVMLYVDGMEGLIRHNATVQWLYSLLASKVRLVVKTALKLLLVFVEYTESNTVQLIRAIETVDSRRGLHPWTNVMALLNEKDGADSELLIYTMTLINKVISAIPDQDTFYDVTDALEELGMDAVTHRLMNKQGADLDLLAQFQLYESALKLEDGEDNSVISQVENLRQVPRKKSESYARKSKRHEGGLELSLPDYSQSQSQAPGLPPEAAKRKDEKRESLGELQLPDRNELNQRVHLQTIEKTSPTSQRKSISPQNARNRRMSRQRIFMEEKHELLAVVDKQDQNLKEPNMTPSERNLESRFKASQGFPTPFFQAQKSPNVHLQTETLPQSFPASSSLLSTMSTNTSLSGSVYGSDDPVPELNLGSRTSYDYNRAPDAVSRELHNSYNGEHFSNNRQPEQPQDLSEFHRDQDVLDFAQSASSVSYLSSSAGAQSNQSTNSVNFSHPQHRRLTQEEVPVDKPHLNTSQHPNPHQQPHHPHFHNHYHSLDHSTQQGYSPDYQGYVILNNDQSFSSDGNFSSKGLPINEYRQSSFEDVQKVYLSQNSGHPRGDSQLPDRSYFGDKQDDAATVYSNQRGGVYSSNNQIGLNTQSHQNDFMTSQSQQMVENGFLGTQEGQVRNMQTKLKNEGYGGPKEAMRPVGDFSGIISTAKNNLTRQTTSTKLLPVVTVADVEKKAESDFQWDRIQRRLNRQLKIKDMDFSDLKDEDDKDIFSSVIFEGSAGGGVSPTPPPPPPIGGIPHAPPPAFGDLPPPPPPLNSLSPSPLVGGRNSSQQFFSSLLPPPGADLKKSKKTLRLHWRALPGDNSHPATKGEVIWKQLVPVAIDTNKLEHLFETRSSELKSKEMKQDGSGKREITVLETKRSNAINIGLTVLPPGRTIKAAILKMDNSIMNKEGIEKILTTMIPSEEEKAKIIEAQMANPDIPLGTAEQFLLTMSSIFELEARLKLWLFKLDYEMTEQEVAEPLMDLKKGIVELRRNKTFKCILSAILTIGNFLNGAAVHAFNIEFLQRLPEIKDTVRKQSLLHHLCTLIIEQFPDTTDLYSEIGPITRCSRVDFDELSHKLNKMENDCKASWDYLQSIVKHDGSTTDLKGKMSTFLADAAERIMILTIIFKRIKNRYNKMLLFLGFPPSEAREMKVNHFCKVISEFALEYRTTRDKVLQMMQKKANQRERKKTRGKMIVDTENFRSKKAANDDALKQILKNGYTGTDERGISGHRGRRRPVSDGKSVNATKGGTTTDSDMFDTGDDEILEACVRSAASAPSSRPQRERRRARTQRKSLRRTLKGGLSLDEQQVLETHDEHV